MPRKYSEPRVEIKVSLPESVVAKLDLLTYDPVRGKPGYGKRSEIISSLVTRYIDEHSTPTSTPEESTND